MGEKAFAFDKSSADGSVGKLPLVQVFQLPRSYRKSFRDAFSAGRLVMRYEKRSFDLQSKKLKTSFYFRTGKSAKIGMNQGNAAHLSVVYEGLSKKAKYII